MRAKEPRHVGMTLLGFSYLDGFQQLNVIGWLLKIQES